MDTKASPGPIIVDVGKQSSKRIKQLKKGGGRLSDEVVQAVQTSHGPNAVPVVVLYEQKSKRRGGVGMIPFLRGF